MRKNSKPTKTGTITLLAALCTVQSLSASEIEGGRHPASSTVRGNSPEVLASPSESVDGGSLLTRRWRGYRSDLAAMGIQISPIYKFDVVSPFSGATENKLSFIGNLDLKISGETGKFSGWDGGSFLIYGLYNHGLGPSRYVPTTQGLDNIEVETTTFKIYEAWLQHAFLDGKASLLFGLHDLNSEFYVTDSSATFLNPSFGIGGDLSQTGENGPSIFPTTSVAVRGRYEWESGMSFQLGLFDAVAGDPHDAHGTHIKVNSEEGVLLISEVAYGNNDEKKPDEFFKYSLGLWRYTKKVDQNTGTDDAGNALQAFNQGGYVLAEKAFSESGRVFGRLGFAAPSVNPVVANLSYGLTMDGLLPFVKGDKWGIASTTAYLSGSYRDSQGSLPTLSERTYEVFYRAELGRGIALQPDLQWISNPGNVDGANSAWVGTMRAQLDL